MEKNPSEYLSILGTKRLTIQKHQKFLDLRIFKKIVKSLVRCTYCTDLMVMSFHWKSLYHSLTEHFT